MEQADRLNENDFVNFVEKQNQRLRDSVADRQPGILKGLREAGVASLEGYYDGLGDSGQTEMVILKDASGKEILIQDIDEDLAGEIKDFIWDVGYSLQPGFEIDDGGHGTVRWNVVSDRIDVDHYDRFIHTEEHFREEVDLRTGTGLYDRMEAERLAEEAARAKDGGVPAGPA